MSPSSKQSNYGRAAERAWPTRIQVLWELGKPRLALSAVALTVVGGTLAGGLGFESYLRVTLLFRQRFWRDVFPEDYFVSDYQPPESNYLDMDTTKKTEEESVNEILAIYR